MQTSSDSFCAIFSISGKIKKRLYQLVKLDCPHVLCFGDTLCAKQLNNNSY